MVTSIKRILAITLAVITSISLLAGFSTGHISSNTSIKNGIAIRYDEAQFTELFRVPVGNDSGQVGYDIDILAFGPQDFIVKDDGSVFILDSINGKIIIFENSKIINEIDISPMSHYTFAQMFSYHDGKFYVLDLISNSIGIFDENKSQWNVNASNQTKPSGYASVVIPPYVLNATVGARVTGIPYCWGGFDNKANFISKQPTQTGGNTSSATGGLVPGTTGLDCSGFVSRAYGLSTKLNSASFASFGYLKTSNPHTSSGILSLGSMDFIVQSGVHVYLFNSYNSSTSTATVFDAASNATGKVSSRSVNISVFNGYTGRSPWS